jgi:hypothetical protein
MRPLAWHGLGTLLGATPWIWACWGTDIVDDWPTYEVQTTVRQMDGAPVRAISNGRAAPGIVKWHIRGKVRSIGRAALRYICRTPPHS